MKKTAQVNAQLELDVFAILSEIADEQNIKPSTLVGKIITDFVQIYHYKIQRGDITISKPIMKKIFESIDPKRKQEIIDFTSDFIVSEIKVQEGKITYEKLLEHLVKWNKGRFQFNRIHQEGSDLIISKHSMGKMWSEIQCKIYAKCFETVGETVLDVDYESNDSYSIEVAKHSL